MTSLTACSQRQPAKADILNMQFSPVFTSGDASNTPSLGVSQYSELPHIINVLVVGVRHLLEAIKPQKATGPDWIAARLLKDYAAELAPVLSHIYQTSLNEGRVPAPADWKHSSVIPVSKKGARTSPSNYRSIYITRSTDLYISQASPARHWNTSCTVT